MAATPSTMLPLGTLAPEFSLIDTVTGSVVGLRHGDPPAPVTVVAFICNHCPYVLHIINRFVQVVQRAQHRGARVYCVSSNDPERYPQDGPVLMKQFATNHGFTFPYLFDNEQHVARAYHAACTPDLYVFDAQLRCVYRGRFDAATPGNSEPVTGADLSAAITAVLDGTPVPDQQRPSIGCNIKWRMST